MEVIHLPYMTLCFRARVAETEALEDLDEHVWFKLHKHFCHR